MKHRSAPLLLVLLALGACTSTRDSQRANERWLEPSPTLRKDIEQQVQRLPYTHGAERVELIQWFAGVGEPAYPWLLELLEDERRPVRSAAISALGSTSDPRLVPEIVAASWPSQDEDPVLALERARALLRLGDWSEIPVLIRGLEAPEVWDRALCLRTLRDATNQTHGFDPNGTDAERAAAIERWRRWWRERSSDPLLEG